MLQAVTFDIVRIVSFFIFLIDRLGLDLVDDDVLFRNSLRYQVLLDFREVFAQFLEGIRHKNLAPRECPGPDRVITFDGLLGRARYRDLLPHELRDG
ncbi:MAG: hypothetical protein BWY44_00658 [Candidatus Omnitrophica bacterium ADurb.Bin292]|nr:MAG: hypothetical protein BWY44_00658 [Candidatus Omnitrophica bacterium ADurb.Bin292]